MKLFEIEKTLDSEGEFDRSSLPRTEFENVCKFSLTPSLLPSRLVLRLHSFCNLPYTHVHSLFQKKFCTGCDLVISLLIYSIFSFD
jgi:hypothetical protein